MKVFWSWQSDTLGKTGRFLIREALVEAIAALKTDVEITEPTAAKMREELHLDQDRQGVSGSPDLASTILSKIDAAAVVVADVTPVGETFAGPMKQSKKKPSKKLMNPNVAIELGYALGKHSSEQLLMVLNQHHGERDDLPFDLRHKAGPIFYKLSPRATKEQIAAARNHLKQQFVVALRPFIVTKDPPPVAAQRIPSGVGQAVWFKENEVLAKIGDPQSDEVSFLLTYSPLLYLRILPQNALVAPLTRAKLKDAIVSFPTFGRGAGIFRSNVYGAISFEPFGTLAHGQRSQSISSAVQLFANGEIWGANFWFVREINVNGILFIPMQAVESLYVEQTRKYLVAMRDVLKIEGPYQIEVGAVGISGRYIGMPQEYSDSSWGPLHEGEVIETGSVSSADALSELDAILLKFFEKVFDSAGYVRPKRLHGFPSI